MTFGTIILGLISGFVGWLLSEFLAKPVRRGLDMAADAKASLIEFANVRARAGGNAQTPLPERDEKRLAEAEAKFRRLSACLEAFRQTDRLACFVIEKTLFDVRHASIALMQLSNNIGTYGNGRKIAVEEARIALSISLEKLG